MLNQVEHLSEESNVAIPHDVNHFELQVDGKASAREGFMIGVELAQYVLGASDACVAGAVRCLGAASEEALPGITSGD
ncbi:hypothetical protein J6590_079518 [Homalodisca vitripennis]|nr:hypothetical protein J6590_079518 [Homalodisca vitripennis]